MLKIRTWQVAVVVAIAIFIAGLAYLAQARDTAPKPQYTVARVTRGDVIQSIATTGQLTPLVSVEVSSQISGLVTEVNVDFNSPVKKGQVLARIDSSTYRQRLRQARADLEAGQATHSLAVLKARRLRELREQELVTQQDLDEVEAQLRQSSATLLTYQAAVENARLDLERCAITSPISGVVIFKQVEVGKTVISSFSAPTLFTIAQDLSQMRIIAPISEVDISLVRAGQGVAFTVDAIPGRSFEGRLTQIRNPYTPSDKQPDSAQAQQRTISAFDAVIEVDNSDLLLRPSLTANVSIVVARRLDVLRVPNSALRVKVGESSSEDVAVVYRLPKGHRNAIPEAIKVSLGISNNLTTEILDGLTEGDLVITGTETSELVAKGHSLVSL